MRLDPIAWIDYHRFVSRNTHRHTYTHCVRDAFFKLCVSWNKPISLSRTAIHDGRRTDPAPTPSSELDFWSATATSATFSHSPEERKTRAQNATCNHASAHEIKTSGDCYCVSCLSGKPPSGFTFFSTRATSFELLSDLDT